MATPTQQTSAVATTQQHQNPYELMCQAQKQALSSGARSYILKPNDGESIRLRILKEMTEGTVIHMHRLPNKPFKAMCGSEMGVPCEYCARAKAGEWKLQAALFMYLPCVVVLEDEHGKKGVNVRLLELYPGKNTIFAKLQSHFSTNSTVCSCDFVYSRTGSGLKTTTYDFSAQISASIYRQDTITRLATTVTPDRVRERVAEAFPLVISDEDEVGDAMVVESSVVSDESSADDARSF